MMNIICATCHLFGMSSACANPFLYGWFNENFRGEFKLIFAVPYRLLCPTRATSEGNRRRPSHCISSATTCTSVPDTTMSTLGQSKQRRIAASTRSAAIDTSIDEMMNKNSTIGPAERPNNVPTVKEVIAMVDRQNVVETKLILRSSSTSEGHSNIDSDNIGCPARSDGIDAKAVLNNPIFSSSTLETHL